MKNIYLLICLCTSNIVLSQANFSGNVYDVNSKSAVENVKLMIVEEKDTTYVIPDSKGDFKFKTKPGRVKIYAVADGFISELNSLNAGDGSMNSVNIGLINEEMISELSAKEIKSTSYSSYEKHSGSRAPEGSALTLSEAFFSDHEGTVTHGVKNMPKGGVLTAGEINDFAKWRLWNDLNENLFDVYAKSWKLILKERYSIQLMLPSGMPVIDAEVELIDNTGKSIWIARTDNTGKAELWDTQPDPNSSGKYSMKVSKDDFEEIFRNVHNFKRGINSFKIDVPCTVSDQLDIAFVVDATGSMGDEINYLKMDLDSVISLIADENKNINLRMASVFYRDNGDEYVTQEAPFSTNSQLVKNFIKSNEAGGGGDYPEAADEALMTALKNLNWSTTARARILFWLLDAPPHKAEENLKKLEEVSKLAAKMGIKIIPVGCSGIDKSTEFLCRSIALATNGTYTFLTNHSGIGGSHIEPSTDGYKVESFRDILVRVARSMSITPDCNEFIAPEQIVMIDSNLRIENPYGKDDSTYVNRLIDSMHLNLDLELGLDIALFPNPTNGIFNIKNPKEITEAFIVDINGKILERVSLNTDRTTMCDIGKYSNGIYFVQYHNTKKWSSKKIILQH